MRSAPLVPPALLLLALPAAAQVANPANGHTYFHSPAPAHWSTWRALAEELGADLVTISDAAERAWIVAVLPLAAGDTCIGLTDEVAEGIFLWVSGEPLAYQDWGAGSPAPAPSGDVRDHVVMRSASAWRWHDDGSFGGAIIEYDATPSPAVADLVATSWPVELSWRNPVPYDSIDLYRLFATSDDTGPPVLLATLPGTATEWSSAAPFSALGLAVVGRVSGSPALPARVDLPPAHLFVPPVIAADTGPGEARVMLDILCEPGVSGWSFGLCSDPGAVAITAIAMGATTAAANDGQGPYFRSVQLLAGGCTVGVIYEGFAGVSLGPGAPRELEIVTFEALLPGPFATTLAFCETLGTPPVPVTVVVGGGEAEDPRITDGVVEIRARHFIRADANGDLSVDLGDPIFVGAWLFGGGEEPGCIAAADSNGDQLVDVADMVTTLGYLFQAGSSPGAPFPGCGPEPAPALGCATPPDCP